MNLVIRPFAWIAAAILIGSLSIISCGSFSSNGADAGATTGSTTATTTGTGTGTTTTGTTTSTTGTGTTGTGTTTGTTTTGTTTTGTTTTSTTGTGTTGTTGTTTTGTTTTGTTTTGTTTGQDGGQGGDSAVATGTRPCDIFGAAVPPVPCVAAHSTVRALYASYSGPLYQVCKGTTFTYGGMTAFSCTSGMTMDIGTVAGGYADAAAQDTFCSGGSCSISIIYDQSPNHNDLKVEGGGGYIPQADVPAIANALSLTIAGNKVYGVHIVEHSGYRNNCGGKACPGLAVGDEPETMYMLTSGTYFNGGCCFDYGNAETNSSNDGTGTMETVYFGNVPYFSSQGVGTGPWVESDEENGVYAGLIVNKTSPINPTNMSLADPYVTAMVIGDTADKNGGKGRFALYGANSQTDMAFQVEYDGPRPEAASICDCAQFVPMRKQGAIVLGTGGDNSNGGEGNFYEGVITSGAALEATANAVEANILAAGYGH